MFDLTFSWEILSFKFVLGLLLAFPSTTATDWWCMFLESGGLFTSGRKDSFLMCIERADELPYLFRIRSSFLLISVLSRRWSCSVL